MDKPDDGFVSRRGKQVRADSLDLGSLSIDDAQQQTSSVASPRVIHRTRTIRLGVRSIVVAFVVIVALPIIIGEILSWQYRSSVVSTKQSFNSIVQGDVLRAQSDPSMTSDDLSQITNKIYSLSSQMCRGGLIDNMASLYPRANSSRQDCTVAQERYSALVGSLRSFENQQRYLEQLYVVIRPIATPTIDQFAIISAQLELWQSVQSKMDRLIPPDSLRAEHTALLGYTKAITTNWSQLYSAYNDEDNVKFDSASSSITEKYQQFRATESQFSTAIATSQMTVVSSYSAL